MPFPPSKRPPRQCALCGHPELTDARGLGRFLLVPDPAGRGPVCPSQRGCRGGKREASSPSTLTQASR
ncbi:hypothetical protein FJV41_44515 [Myxococcus llanfairpwllgwyngyllgogerychwyrndrobwllllantysiliogogogochensis]|uniref:Uncharacterized protein n=1 Tax=Myxococcus llanfairpwllgwyngyllgogerychwyrndrobwllllantysiliogogogochensis TaxID=2590453 RepID=A0A540WK99_9BACT|nr:hypothetical protein FJV41_44515 [Myxococcus llanfairpwllgwyngyllgogerychwyrndrobwllllantysiliogogogochensis]